MFKNPNESGCMKWECSGTLMLMALLESRCEGACVMARYCSAEFPYVGRRRDNKFRFRLDESRPLGQPPKETRGRSYGSWSTFIRPDIGQ